VLRLESPLIDAEEPKSSSYSNNSIKYNRYLVGVKHLTALALNLTINRFSIVLFSIYINH
jgi:hypothetical protein